MTGELSKISLLGVMKYWLNRDGCPPDPFREAGAYSQIKVLIERDDERSKT